MSYENLCAELYGLRLQKKDAQQKKRDEFRQAVLSRQNSKSAPEARSVRSDENSDIDGCKFEMPEILPANEAKLKWLIFQNIELIQNNPERKKEAQDNIKKIKSFINEQKK